ncbi:MAG: hypothetical protein ACMUHB_06115 [Thermoplasmatota archaeon]
MDERPSFIKGLLAILGIYLVAIPVILVPLVGQILAFTLVPYIAAAVGSRYADPKERLPLAFTGSIIWCSVITLVALFIMNKVASVTPMGFQMDSFAWIVLVMVWVFNTSFTVLGALYTWRDPFVKSE